MSGDEQEGSFEEARTLIGATWEALAEERARAARARRQTEGRIAELEQALAAARDGTSEADSEGVALAAQLKRQRDELRAQVRAGEHALRAAETERDRLATRLRRRERDQTRAQQVAQELKQERNAHKVAQDERDELAARLEREQAAQRVACAVPAPEARASAPPAGRPDADARTARARADERERQLRARAAERIGRAVEEKRGVERALAQAISDRDRVAAERDAARKERAALAAQIAEREREARDRVSELERDRLRQELSGSTGALTERDAQTQEQRTRIKALESTNADHVRTAQAYIDAKAELSEQMERLIGERDEHKRRADQTGDQLKQGEDAIRAIRDDLLKVRQALKKEKQRERERDALRQELEDSNREYSSRVEALEAVNAQLTDIARRDAQTQRELAAQVESLTDERNELQRRAQTEAGDRDESEQRMIELEQRASRALDRAALSIPKEADEDGDSRAPDSQPDAPRDRPATAHDHDHVQALESVNAQLTEAVRHDARAHRDLMSKVEQLTDERDELQRRIQDEARIRELLEEQVVELKRRASRATDEAAITRRT